MLKKTPWRYSACSRVLESLREVVRQPAGLDLRGQEPRQPVPLPHVAQPAALERGDDVVRVVHDEAARGDRARLAEHQVVVEVGPYRHRPVAQPHELRALDRRPAERARDAAPGEVLRRAPRQREDAARGGGDLVVALAGLEVLLVDLGTGRQPVPEHIGQRRPAAAAVGGGMGVEPLEARCIGARAGQLDGFLAVDACEDPHAKPDDRRRQPARQARRHEHGCGKAQ